MSAGVLKQLVQLEDAAAVELKQQDAQLQASQKEHQGALDKLFKRRQELVSGKALPTAEELAGHEPSSAAGAAADAKRGVPCYWLTVLCNQDTIAEELSSRDRQALAHLTSIRAVAPGGGPPVLEFAFSSNPFFTNSTLRRGLGSDDGTGTAAVTTDIQWKDTAHKLTVKEVKKGGGGKKKKSKGGKGGGNDEGAAGGGSVKLKPCASFFRFFLPESSSNSSSSAAARLHDPAALRGDDDDEDDDEGRPVKSAKQEHDELLMGVLLREVLPKATTLYLSGPLQAPSDESDEDDFALVSHGVVAGSSVDDLPSHVQAVVAALKHNQAQLDELAAAQAARAREAAKAGTAVKRRLAERRRALLLPSGAAETAVERFWLRVLRATDAGALAISSRDAAVLAQLADVRFSLSGGGGSGGELHGKLELEFLPGGQHLAPACSLLSKAYTFDVEPATGEPRLLAARVTGAPAWASAELDPTLRPKGRGGAMRPAASLFQLFKLGGGKFAFNLTGDDKEAQAEANELETELLLELDQRLLLQSGSIYTRLAREGWHDDDNAAGDAAAWRQQAAEEEEEEASSSDGGDDEGEAAHSAAVRRAKAKARGGFKWTKATVLAALVVLMLLAELVVFLDMAEWFR